MLPISVKDFQNLKYEKKQKTKCMHVSYEAVHFEPLLTFMSWSAKSLFICVILYTS